MNFVFVFLFLLISFFGLFQCELFNLKTIDPSKKKIGVLTLSAIKMKSLIDLKYNFEDLKVKHSKDFNTFLRETGYLADNYREWLESADIQVIPILFYKSFKEILDLMENLDGFVLTGGSESFFMFEGKESLYLRVVNEIVDKAKSINDQGRVFPIWGICLGFQSLLVVESKNKLKRHKVNNHWKLRQKIRFTDFSLRSVKYFSDEDLDLMEDYSLLYFNHMFGVSRRDIQDLEETRNKIKIGAKINTISRRNVAAWIEFVDYPFFGSQFHPEKDAKAGANPFDVVPGKRVLSSDQSDDIDDEMPQENLIKEDQRSFEKDVLKQKNFFADNFNEENTDFEKNKTSDENKFSNVGSSTKKTHGLNPMDNVHPAIKTEKFFRPVNNKNNDEGVDSLGKTAVIDENDIPKKYLEIVDRINKKFAEFFGTFVHATGRKISQEFLNKQIFWLENIGSYYKINLITDNK